MVVCAVFTFLIEHPVYVDMTDAVLHSPINRYSVELYYLHIYGHSLTMRIICYNCTYVINDLFKKAIKITKY